MLDISIKNLEKILITDDLRSMFMNTEWSVEEKYDGTKLTLVRNDQEYDQKHPENNWIIAYKGNIMYHYEFQNVDVQLIKKESIGCSQYKLVWDNLKLAHKHCEDIPKNTEFFVEFLMRKPTLTRQYKLHHHLFLIGYASTKYRISGGKLETEPEHFKTINRDVYADCLQMRTPQKLGLLIEDFYEDGKDVVEQIREWYLLDESFYGGPREGIVIKCAGGEVYKVLQKDQHDKEVRWKIKQKYKMDREKENAYYQEITNMEKVSVGLCIGESGCAENDFDTILEHMCVCIYHMKDPLIKHEKKTAHQINDDQYLTAKGLLLRKLKGNNWAAFIGKFRCFSKMHYKIIKEALLKYDGVVVGIVTGKNQIIPKEFREKIIKECISNHIEILHLKSGNFIDVFRKTTHNINVILCGTDRVDDYKSQLKNNLEIKVVEIERNNDISSTNIIKDVMNNEYNLFMKNTPKKVWKYFERYKEIINTLKSD